MGLDTSFASPNGAPAGGPEATYRALFENMLEGLARCRLEVDQHQRAIDFTLLEVNASFTRLTCRPGADGRRFSEVFPGVLEAHPQLLEAYARVVATGRPERFEMALEPLDCWVEIAAYASGPREFVTVFADITDRKQSDVDQARIRAELESQVAGHTAALERSVDELRRFSYALTHHLREPLRTLRSFAELTLAERSVCEEGLCVDYVQRMATAARWMDELVCDALDYSRMLQEELPLESLDVGPLVLNLVTGCPTLDPLHGALTLDAPLPRVEGNAGALTQCCANLLSNAVKFAAPERPLRVIVRGERLGDRTRLWFEDNGLGVPAESLETIFTLFGRSHPEIPGTGLGLAIVAKLVERMGGTCGVLSREGQGSRFWIELRQGG